MYLISKCTHGLENIKHGSEDALKDHRGRKKPIAELNEYERFKLRIKELEARNEYLEMENAFAKKLAGDQATKYTLTLVRQADLYQAIQELNKEKGYAITKLCELAGVARSAYYKWLKWKPSAKELEILSLAKEVKLRYDKRKGILGYRQIRTQLNRKLKKNYNKKRYYRIMRALGLKAVIRRKRPNYVKASEIHVVENVMNRNFDADSPNSKWCTDVTELKYGNGRKAYLSAIIVSVK